MRFLERSPAGDITSPRLNAIYWKYRPFIRGVQVAAAAWSTPRALAEQASLAAAFSAPHSERFAASTPDHAGAAIVHDHDAQDLYIAIQVPRAHEGRLAG